MTTGLGPPSVSRTTGTVFAKSREHYHRLRSTGHSHGRALRGLADRLLALLCAMLRSGTAYDPLRHQSIESPSA